MFVPANAGSVSAGQQATQSPARQTAGEHSAVHWPKASQSLSDPLTENMCEFGNLRYLPFTRTCTRTLCLLLSWSFFAHNNSFWLFYWFLTRFYAGNPQFLQFYIVKMGRIKEMGQKTSQNFFLNPASRSVLVLQFLRFLYFYGFPSLKCFILEKLQ